jgi:hypothetical protein
MIIVELVVLTLDCRRAMVIAQERLLPVTLQKANSQQQKTTLV